MKWPPSSLPRWPFGRRDRHTDRLPLCLRRQRIYIVPSRVGLAWAGLLGVMFFGALNYLNNAALLLTCELAAAMALTMLGSFRNLYALTLQAIICPQPTAGQRTPLQLQFAPSSRRRERLLAQALHQQPKAFSLPAGTRADPVLLPVCFAERGLQPLPAIQLMTRWPLGLFTAWSRLRPAQQVLVWPAIEVAGPALPGRHSSDPLSSGPGQVDLPPDGLRDYRDGDPLAHIAWKLLARNDEWHTKTPPANRHDRQLELDWAQTDDLPYEARIRRLAHWLNLAHRDGLRVSLQLPGRYLPADHGTRHYAQCMDALARLP